MTPPSTRRNPAFWLILGSCAAVLTLAWFGYHASREWRRTSVMLVRGRASEAADLLLRTLARDMRGVDESILSGLHWDEVDFEPPYDVRDVIAGAFARYPYPEFFFGWDGALESNVVLFTRADREPPWMSSSAPLPSFPVRVTHDGRSLRSIVARIAPVADAGRRFAAFETDIGGTRYQVVVRLMYRDARRLSLARVLGFAVNLRWAREQYFPELTEEVARLTAAGAGLQVTITDDHGRAVAGNGSAPDSPFFAERLLHPLFFEPELVLANDMGDLPTALWTVHVDAGADPSLVVAAQSAEWTVGWTTLAALVCGVSLWLAARALRARTELAQLRGDFVASVTHELKTPLATILSAAEALARGRVSGSDRVAEYAQLVDQEAKRLGRLVNNLLAYSRITDVHEAYTFEPIAITDLLDDVLRGFQHQVSQLGFAIDVEPATDLPPIRGDRQALVMVFDNVVDNALRYSRERKRLALRTRRDERYLAIDVEDEGIGIAEDELDKIVRRFVRGRHAPSGGSGLGLSIASQIVRDHNGTLHVSSDEGRGTIVTVRLPVME